MQNMKIEVKVDELLRLALLLEHGGVLLRITEAFPVGNFNWI